MKKKVNTKRSYDNPNIAWESKDSKTKIFILGENESIPTLTSTNYEHHFKGPSIVVETINMCRTIEEHNINDNKIWEWISKLIAKGMPKDITVTTVNS